MHEEYSSVHLVEYASYDFMEIMLDPSPVFRHALALVGDTSGGKYSPMNICSI